MKTLQQIYEVQYRKDQNKFIYNTMKRMYYDYLYYTLDCNYSYGAFRSIVSTEQYDKLKIFKVDKHDAREFLSDHFENYKIYNKCNYKTLRAENMVYNKLFKIASKGQLNVLAPAPNEAQTLTI